MASHLVRLPAAALVAALGIALTAATPAQAHNDTGALVGGLIAGAVIGGAVVAASDHHHHHHDNYYYYGGPAPAYYPPPPPVYGPVYGPGYCGAPPYPPCRTPVPY